MKLPMQLLDEASDTGTTPQHGGTPTNEHNQ